MRLPCHVLATAFLSAVAALSLCGTAHGRPFRPGLIPNGNVNRCANCHVRAGGGGPRNAFGQAVRQFVSPNGSERFWSQVFNLDSDRDGFTNGAELQDPNGTWRAGQADPGDSKLVTKPWDPNSFPQVQNRAPVFGQLPESPTVREGRELRFVLKASDEDGDTLTFSATNLPQGASLADSVFTWTPGGDQAGQAFQVSFAVSDGKDSASKTLTIQVLVNRAPVFGQLPEAPAVNEGEELRFVLKASDEDGDTLTFAASGLPEGATLADSVFTWTPGFDQGAQTFPVSFIVDDGVDSTATELTIQVLQVDRPVRITAFEPASSRVAQLLGTAIQFLVSAEDPDGDEVSFVWKVNGMAQPTTGPSFQFTVGEGDDGTQVSVEVRSTGDPVTQAWIIATSLTGDFNGNGTVDFSDFLAFAAAFGKGEGQEGFDTKFDLNGNGSVDFPDFLTFASFFGLSIA